MVGVIVALGLFVFGGRLYIASRTPEWIAQLQDPDPIIRREAALWLNELAPPAPDVLDALMAALQDDYVGVRQQAAHGLGKFGPRGREAIPLLLETLNDDDEAVRFNAAGSLRAIGHDPTVHTLHVDP